jgi:hypothetical protein
MRAYNLFRHKGETDLYCAVPEDLAVPAFLTEDAWEYVHWDCHGSGLAVPSSAS